MYTYLILSSIDAYTYIVKGYSLVKESSSSFFEKILVRESKSTSLLNYLYEYGILSGED